MHVDKEAKRVSEFPFVLFFGINRSHASGVLDWLHAGNYKSREACLEIAERNSNIPFRICKMEIEMLGN